MSLREAAEESSFFSGVSLPSPGVEGEEPDEPDGVPGSSISPAEPPVNEPFRGSRVTSGSETG